MKLNSSVVSVAVDWNPNKLTANLYHNDPACLVPARLEGRQLEIINVRTWGTRKCQTCGKDIQ
jgi:hypothetical protein